MKKNYFKPEVSAVDIILENFMLGASAGGGSIIPGGSDKPGGDGDFANRNRGEWGNVWAGGSN